jgi:hemerythrin-like metal-binding protein
MQVPWSDVLKVGDTEIDTQHQELFRRVNLLLEMTDTICLTKCVIPLFRHTREHFSHEEEVMRRIQYPDILPHIIAHNHLLKRLNELAVSIANETFVKNDWQAFFHAWLINHIESSDRPLLGYINTHALPLDHIMPAHTYGGGFLNDSTTPYGARR